MKRVLIILAIVLPSLAALVLAVLLVRAQRAPPVRSASAPVAVTGPSPVAAPEPGAPLDVGPLLVVPPEPVAVPVPESELRMSLDAEGAAPQQPRERPDVADATLPAQVPVGSGAGMFGHREDSGMAGMGTSGGAPRDGRESELLRGAEAAAPPSRSAPEDAFFAEAKRHHTARKRPDPAPAQPQEKGGLAATDGTPGDRDLGRGAGGERLGDRELAPPDAAPSGERPFVRVDAPGGDASTFGLDVDTASWGVVARSLREGRRPAPEEVRVEELINAFPYGYAPPAPADGQPLRIRASVAACPWAPAHRLVRVALRARDAETRPPLNVVFLVDTSGSMAPADRLPLVQRGLVALAGRLGAQDRLAIVTYASGAQVALPAMAGGDPRIAAGIRGLEAGGSTNGAGGIQLAYAEALRHHRAGVQSRVVLCTDGDFNVGVSDADGLRRLITEERAKGIYLSVYGVGMGDRKDATLETLANTGNGAYAYLSDERGAQEAFVAGAMGALVTVAKDVKVQVFFNPATAQAWRLLGYDNRRLRREDFADDRVDAGEIGAGHTVTALYEVVPAGAAALPADDRNPFIAGDAPVAAPVGPLLRLRLRWQPPTGGASLLHEQDVDAAPTAMDGDFRFAAAVAGFGLLLRGSPHRGDCSWDLVQALAGSAAEADDVRRSEFVALVHLARRH